LKLGLIDVADAGVWLNDNRLIVMGYNGSFAPMVGIMGYGMDRQSRRLLKMYKRLERELGECIASILDF
jgi:hypothetical protein